MVNGLNLFDDLFLNLPIIEEAENREKPFMMYIDKVYSVVGVGTVVSGTIRQGNVNKGDRLLLGPDGSGRFIEVGVKTMEMHHYKKDHAEVGEVVGISITGVDMDDIKRGMILCSSDYEMKGCQRFRGRCGHTGSSHNN